VSPVTGGHRVGPGGPSRVHFPLAPPDDLPRLVGRALRVLGVDPAADGLWLDDETLTAAFGPWRLSTRLANVAGAETSGPYSAWKAVGPRLSLADRGLTFGTSARAGACIRFREPVPGIEPFGVLRHPNLTVTVADPARLVARLRRDPPPAA
jgi:hypothetical protein